MLDKGHLLQVGTPREVYRRPRTRAVADFIGESNFIEGRALEPVADTENWRVSTALGEFTGLKPDEAWDLHVGEPVVLSIRPESWKLREAASAGSAGAENTLRGRIGRSVYLGEVAEYDFQPTTGQNGAASPTLRILEMNPRFVEVADHTEISARVSPDDVIVLHP